MSNTARGMPPEGHLASVNGIQMYYEVHGEGDPLVLLHWWTGSSQSWEPFIVDLAKEYQLIIPDLRGHGRSTNPTSQFTFRQSALDVFALLDELKIDRFKAMGGSGGGLTLLHMATQQLARVEAMVLIGAPSYWSEQNRAFTRQSKDWDLDWDQLRQRHVYGDDQIRTLLDQLYSFADKYGDAYANFTPPYLSIITAKTLIVDGDRDPFIHVSMLVEMYTFIPDAYLWIIPNGKHMAIGGKHAAVFTQTALEFLRGDWETT